MAKEETKDSSPEVSTTAEGQSSSPPGTRTITINGQQYQIMSPTSIVPASNVQTLHTLASSMRSSTGQTTVLKAAVSPNIQTVTTPQIQSVSGRRISGGLSPKATDDPEEATRKRQIRLMKNREAARECRNKKKEYIKCLENRVAVLEKQNKALIEELKSLKELYTGQQK